MAPALSHRSLAFVLAGLAAAAAARSADAQAAPNQIFPAAQYPSDWVPHGIAVADFSGDGKLDVLATSNNNLTATLLTGDGAGVFTKAGTFATGWGSHGIKSADFNGDGRPDAIMANSATSQASVLVNNALGGFLPQTQLNTVYLPWMVALGDVNLDGKVDVAISSSSTIASAAGIHLGDGAGGFGALVNIPAGSALLGVALGDVHNDGKPDLAVGKYPASLVRVFRGNGAGGFVNPVDVPSGPNPTDLTFFDMDNDNDLDLASANAAASSLSVLRNNGGSLTNHATLAVGTAPGFVIADDLDADGDADLCNANSEAFDVTRHLGDGAGGFAGAKSYPVGSHPQGIAAADVNGDGLHDLVVANSLPSVGPGTGSHTVSVLLGLTGGDFETPVNSPTGDAPNGLALGDWNRDGLTDAAVTHDAQEIRFLLGNGAGSMLTVQTIGAAGPVRLPACIDANLDGALDVIALQASQFQPAQSQLVVYPGNPQGVFGAAIASAIAGATAFAAGDLDNNGTADAVVLQGMSNTFLVMLGTGTGTLTPTIPAVLGNHPKEVNLADFNGDGALDAVLIREFAFMKFTNANAHVFFGNGVGGWSAGWTSPTFANFSGLSPGDADFDGDLDFCTSSTSSLRFFLNDGTGTFTHSTTGINGASPVLADVTGDARVDLLSAFETVRVAVALSPGSYAPLQLYGAGDYVTQIASADFNLDGRSDLTTVNTRGDSISVLPNRLGGIAGVTPYGTGTPGCLGAETVLSNQSPAVGTPGFQILSQNSPRLSKGLLLVADAQDLAGTDVLTIGVLFHVDLATLTELLAFDIESDAFGVGSASTPIPFNPLLSGKRFYAQTIWAWRECMPSPFSLSSSRGCTLAIQ
jgi:hypothetical protein